MGAARPRPPSRASAARPRAKEVAAWDIDVRPDFKGLPEGSGTVASGMEMWEAKCASCHGVFGESNEVFSPLIGGTTADDIETGRVARLTDAAYPGRTTMMKVPTLVHAVGLHQPRHALERAQVAERRRGLRGDGLHAEPGRAWCRRTSRCRTATSPRCRQRMPNRNGMTTDHGLWPGKGWATAGEPDVPGHGLHDATAPPRPRWPRFLPDHARNAHGNLAEQNRLVGRAARRRHHAPGRGRAARQPRRRGRGRSRAHRTRRRRTAARRKRAPATAAAACACNARCAACHAVRPQGASAPAHDARWRAAQPARADKVGLPCGQDRRRRRPASGARSRCPAQKPAQGRRAGLARWIAAGRSG
jgi:cytochrome c